MTSGGEKKAFRKIYDLRDDVSFVAQVQKASQETLDFGLVPEHGLFGTHGWWDAVAAGKIETYSATGRIKRIYMGSMNDWPEFELNEDGNTSVWSRYSSTPDGGSAYVVERHIRVDYVLQKPKTTRLADTHKMVIEVWVEDE